jgi:hypothetical protein
MHWKGIRSESLQLNKVHCHSNFRCCWRCNCFQVPANACSIANGPLEKNFVFEFCTPTLKILKVLPGNSSYNIKRNPIIFIAFDQRVLPSDILRSVECYTMEKKVRREFSLSNVDPTTLPLDQEVASEASRHSTGFYVTLQSRCAQLCLC